jgi:hypothetical protein
MTSQATRVVKSFPRRFLLVFSYYVWKEVLVDQVKEAMDTWTSCPDSTSASDSATSGNRVRYRGIFSRRSRAVRYAQQRCYCVEEETLCLSTSFTG